MIASNANISESLGLEHCTLVNLRHAFSEWIEDPKEMYCWQWITLMSVVCVSLHGTLGWSMICDRGISWSYSLIFLGNKLCILMLGYKPLVLYTLGNSTVPLGHSRVAVLNTVDGRHSYTYHRVKGGLQHYIQHTDYHVPVQNR